MRIYRLVPACMFVNNNLNPLHNARMSGYGFLCSSYPWGITLTGQLCSRAFSPALKHR